MGIAGCAGAQRRLRVAKRVADGVCSLAVGSLANRYPVKSGILVIESLVAQIEDLLGLPSVIDILVALLRRPLSAATVAVALASGEVRPELVLLRHRLLLLLLQQLLATENVLQVGVRAEACAPRCSVCVRVIAILLLEVGGWLAAEDSIGVHLLRGLLCLLPGLGQVGPTHVERTARVRRYRHTICFV